ncbi:MAG: adenylyl-sulfate reductase subunit alpha [Clostridium sp.]
MEKRVIETDILIIGGGACGCYAAITLGKLGGVQGILIDKAAIKRSGCLAAGVNAINAYLNEGETPEKYVEYVKKEFDGIVREDLIYSIGKSLNRVTRELEEFGVPFLKNEKGEYEGRGKRSVKINGENIKPLLSKKVREFENIKVIEKITVVDYILKKNRVIGAVGIHGESGEVVVIYAKGVICATGGASRIYKPNNSGFSKHKMWYSPFNTGAGLGMGIRAGAEMTSLEARFIALRIKDTIAPTGTVAQGIRTPQINAFSEEYLKKYSNRNTSTRLYGTLVENKEGRGPCYLKTSGINEEEELQLKKAYLNMAPAQALSWFDNEVDIKKENIEIEGTEPYIVGGHSSSGYWIDDERRTTIKGLYAGGDVAGGSPKKYVTGAMVEGEIAINTVVSDIKGEKLNKLSEEEERELMLFILKPLFRVKRYEFNTKILEEGMQKIMDEYAGGISQKYEYSEKKLNIALKEIEKLSELLKEVGAESVRELIDFYELRDRLDIANSLIMHLLERKETRLRVYGENLSYGEKNKEFNVYINSVLRKGKVEIIRRELTEGVGKYEHFD